MRAIYLLLLLLFFAECRRLYSKHEILCDQEKRNTFFRDFFQWHIVNVSNNTDLYTHAHIANHCSYNPGETVASHLDSLRNFKRGGDVKMKLERLIIKNNQMYAQLLFTGFAPRTMRYKYEIGDILFVPASHVLQYMRVKRIEAICDN